MRRGMRMQNDGYDTADEVPLSQLRKRGESNAGKGVNNNKNDPRTITNDLSKSLPVKSNTKEVISMTGSPTEGVVDRDGDPMNGTMDMGESINDGVLNDGEIQPTSGELKQNQGGEVTAPNVKGDNGIDPVNPLGIVNSEQLTERKEDDQPGDILAQLFKSIENINVKLEKLNVVEHDVKELSTNLLKKEDVEKIIQQQLVSVKTTLVSHDLKIAKQQTEMNNMETRITRHIDELKTDFEKKAESCDGVGQKDIETMIEKAHEKIRKEGEVTGKPKGRMNGDERRLNRNVIIHGMAEDRRVEDLSKVQDVAHDIGLSLHRWDVDRTVRIGAFEKGKKRPLKVELVSETTKMDLLKNKKKLNTSELYSEIQIVPDETKEVRHAKAILRQAAYLAGRNGDKVWKRHDLIWVNGVKYTVDTVDQIPDELRFQRKPVKDDQKRGETRQGATSKPDNDKDEGILDMETTEPQEISSDNFQNKNWDQASRAAHNIEKNVEMDGAMHLTKRGLAFFTGKTYLSNFFVIDFKFNGRVFRSAEHAYQCEKAWVCRDVMRGERIYKAKTPKEAKTIGYEIQTTPLWEKLKDDRMREILDAKFTQNVDIRKKLLETTGLYLIEGSTDGYWGAGKRLYSADLMEGRWNGQNKLGEMLVDLRTDLRRRGYN